MTDYERMLEEQRLRDAEAQNARMMMAQQQALRQQQSQQSQGGGGGGMSPGMAGQIGEMFAGGGGGAGGGASVAGLASGEAPVAAGSLYGGFGSAPVAVGAAEGLGAGGAAGSGGGGALAAAGPWAALAAAIAANEHFADQAGRRGDSDKDHLRMAITGEGMKEDMDYYGDKVGGPLGKSISAMGTLGSPIDSTKSTIKHFKKAFKKPFEPWEWF